MAEGAETLSLFGDPLFAPAPSAARAAEMEDQLAVARAAWEAAPDDEDHIIWYGRRTAYLGRYQEAIDIYSDGLALHPDSPRLLRHRGHRSITLRRFDDAAADLSRAAELMLAEPDAAEPDGQPNARGIPTSSLYTNVYYHLGLAQYLQGDFEAAEKSYRSCLDAARNRDMEVAARYWLFHSRIRQGRPEAAAEIAAAVSPDWDIIENHAYHKLLLLYSGRMAFDEVVDSEDGASVQGATMGYGVARWQMQRGEEAAAQERMLSLVRSDQWAAFGTIAAEADLHRSGLRL